MYVDEVKIMGGIGSEYRSGAVVLYNMTRILSLLKLQARCWHVLDIIEFNRRWGHTAKS